MNGYLAFGTLIAIVGVLSLSQATRGVGFIGVACFLVIVARIAQVSELQEWQAPLAVPKIATATGVVIALLVLLTLAVAILSSIQA